MNDSLLSALKDPVVIVLFVVVFAVVFAVGFFTGWCTRNLGTLQRDISAIKMDSFFFYFSILALLFSFIAQGIGILSNLSGIILNIFATMVFSWLLTKFSSKAEFKEQEEQLAKRAHRHMAEVASEAKRTIVILKQTLDTAQDNAIKHTLTTTLYQVTSIHNKIAACNEDWYDLLSTDDQTKASSTRDDPHEDVVADPICDTSSQTRNQEHDFA